MIQVIMRARLGWSDHVLFSLVKLTNTRDLIKRYKNIIKMFKKVRR